MSLAEGAKTAITEFYSDRNTWPTDNAEAGLAGPTDISGNAVTSVTVAGNAITVQFNAMVNSQTLILEGTANDGSFTWTCNTGTVENRWRPARCR
ncbi:MAG: pilin [Azoarcus sp.]|nr:pilin [Azoarcus sp.]